MRYLAEASRPISQRTIREENLKRIFSLLGTGREMSRAALVRATGLSPTTVSALVDEMIGADLLVETGLEQRAQSGRKAINLRINPAGRQIPVFSLNRWGVRYTLYNLALEEMETLFVPHDSGQYGGFSERAQETDPDAGADYAALLEDILTRRSRFFDPSRADVVCVTHPGLYLEGEKAFSLSAMRVSFSHESMRSLQARIDAPLFFVNSSTRFAYAEKRCLEAEGEAGDDLIYLNVCEGVGAGIVLGGEIFTGAGDIGGEIGHVTIDYKGRKCACGSRGCLEQYVSTDAVLNAFRQAAREDRCPGLMELARDSYDNITLELIAGAYDAGLPGVRAMLGEIADILFSGLYAAVCLTGIKRVVIGGGIERLGEGFLQAIAAHAENPRHLLMKDVRVTYALSGFKGDSAGIASYYLDKAWPIASNGGRV